MAGYAKSVMAGASSVTPTLDLAPLSEFATSVTMAHTKVDVSHVEAQELVMHIIAKNVHCSRKIEMDVRK